MAGPGWGRRYLMTRPDHYRVEYAINPWMDPGERVDPARALDQWESLVATVRGLGADVEVIGQRADAPDMVYAMNLGLAVSGNPAGRVVLSHMRHPERQVETPAAAAWFGRRGFAVTAIGAAGIGPRFEAGDAFPYGDVLVVGYGPRTGVDALKPLAERLDVRVLGLAISHPLLYHLDLSFCPLDARHALVCPAAFEQPSAEALLGLVPDPIVVTEQEAFTFCVNSVVVGRTAVMPACPPRIRAQLEARGFRVCVVDVSEFHRGGGSIRCLANPIDLRLTAACVAGGVVHLPNGGMDSAPDVLETAGST